MAVLGRNTLKRDFATGKSPKNQAFAALIDSAPNLADSTAQSFGADIVVSQAVATAGVSAGEMNVTNALAATSAQIDGIPRHGVSAAVSAQSSLGYPILSQEGTAAASATAQIGLMPDSVSIVGLGVRVLAASSGAAGGTVVNIGNQSAIDYFGQITVSAVGSFPLTAVCARRLTGASGAVTMAAPTATAGANFLGRVEYCRTAPAPTPSVRLVEVSALGSAIGNFDAAGQNVSAAFDGVTDQANNQAAAISSTRGFAGQAWGAAKKIGQFAVWDPSNEGWRGNGNIESIRLYGNTSNDINTAALLASVAASYVIPTVVVTVGQTEIDSSIAYPYHWVAVSGGGTISTTYIAEVKFWEFVI